VRAALPTLAGVVTVLAASPAAASPTAHAAVSIPVVPCPARAGVSGQAQPPIPGQLSAPVTPRAAARLRFYSDGYMVVLAPTGWACAGLEAADGGQSLSVFPVGQSDPRAGAAARADAAAVAARFDYTGHGPGSEIVCGFFPSSSAARLAEATGGCPTVPPREVVRHPSRDVVLFVDAPGVGGTGEPSGGTNRASGAVFYPQLAREPASVNVAKVTCTVPKPLAALCPAIVRDLVERARQRPRT